MSDNESKIYMSIICLVLITGHDYFMCLTNYVFIFVQKVCRCDKYLARFHAKLVQICS